MKQTAFVLERTGYGGLIARTREVPAPSGAQVLVRMRAASLNYRDVKILKGIYARPPRLPVVLLSDGAGDVVATGEKATEYGRGDRVLPIYMQNWHSGPFIRQQNWLSLGGDVDGTAQEYGLYAEKDLLPIPADMTFEEAACLPCAGVTAWQALVSIGRLQKGETVLTMGSGGVALFAIQIARMFGAQVIATSGDDRKLARLRELGAAHAINYRSTPDWDVEVRKRTNGRGVDHVVEVGGAGTLERSIRATRDGGHIEKIGDLSGPIDETSMSVPRGITISPIVVGSRAMTAELMRALMEHRMRPIIGGRFAFAELKEALAFLEAGKSFGKVVLTFQAGTAGDRSGSSNTL